MIIRELQCEELITHQDTILEMLVDTYSLNFGLSLERCRAISKKKLEVLDEYIREGSASVLGAFKGGTLIGFLWLYRHDFLGQLRLHVNQIVVAVQFRGNGIGKQLMREAEEQAKRIGIETIDLFVSEANSGAINMYAAMGYQTERRHMKKTLGGRENAVSIVDR